MVRLARLMSTIYPGIVFRVFHLLLGRLPSKADELNLPKAKANLPITKTTICASDHQIVNHTSSCCFSFRYIWKEWGDSNFQIFSQNCQFHHRRLESLEHFNVLYIYIYIILSTTVLFLDLTDAILFLQGLLCFVSFCVCTFPYIVFASTCMLCI